MQAMDEAERLNDGSACKRPAMGGRQLGRNGRCTTEGCKLSAKEVPGRDWGPGTKNRVERVQGAPCSSDMLSHGALSCVARAAEERTTPAQRIQQRPVASLLLPPDRLAALPDPLAALLSL